MSPAKAAPAEASTDTTLSSTDKWRRDHERRAARAAVDQRYYGMMPPGVRLRANQIRIRLTGHAK